MDLVKELQKNFFEVSSFEFYRDVFPVGSFEKKGVYENGKYNGIAVSIARGDNKIKRITVTDELDAISEMTATNDFCLMSPISYAGKTRKSKFARFMYALAIDLDGIETYQQWNTLLLQIERERELRKVFWGLPRPTYLISSGTGIHIYYVFEKPIPMFSDNVEQLEIIKKRLTFQAWMQGASVLTDNVQYESLFQGFRVVGTITKTGKRCRAFRVGKKVSIEYLNLCVPEDCRCYVKYKSELSLQRAKELYPEWYQSRIIEKRSPKTWICKKDLYYWWLSRAGEASQGHRYWYIMALVTYAVKCGIPRKTLERDAFSLIPLLNKKGDRFTEDDVLCALEAFSDSYATYPIDTIVNRTAIPITKNKRNGRKQAVHLERARAVQNIDFPDGEWRNKEGRPKGSSKERKIVLEWRTSHPNGKPKECIADTGISKNTVYRWWNTISSENITENTEKEEKNE